MPLLFAITLFVSAALLFWVQPLIAKTLLPVLGGTPAVWNTCMLFFQGMLLGGYAYVLAGVRLLGARRQAALHLALLLLAVLFVPATLSAFATQPSIAGHNPTFHLLWLLLKTIGLPFFVLSATAPLLQKWFAAIPHPSARDPYFLYAASNAGSLLALLSFPLLLEPNLRVPEQGRIWAALYAVLSLLVAACAVALWRDGKKTSDEAPVSARDAEEQNAFTGAEDHGETITTMRRVRWTLLAFVPSSLVLGVTTYISTDIAAVPLWWVIPLALYLFTFVIAFAKRQVTPRRVLSRALAVAALVVVLVYASGETEPAWFLVLVHLIFFFIAALVCHARLAQERPPTCHLAEFYLWVAVGGALGGVLNALVAPALFDTVLEYPLMIVLACTLRPRVGMVGEESSARWLNVLLPAGVGVLAAALGILVMQFEIGHVQRIALVIGLPLMLTNYFFAERPARFALGLAAVMLGSLVYTGGSGRTLAKERNFYGTLRVTESASGAFHRLQHGSTIHGRQFVDEQHRCEPLSYYHRTGPLGAVFDVFNARTHAPNVAVVGLGTGATVAYARPNQQWTFYEINPAVIEIARDPKLFTYLRDCHANAPVEIALGDARLQLQNAPPHAYGLIVLDAFSSDAIPAHLLTKEALDLYLLKLAEGGLLAFHVSSRSLNLHRVVAGLAQNANLSALVFDDGEHDPISGKEPSQWVAVARRAEDLGDLNVDARWHHLDKEAHPPVWRDDFSNIISVFKWK
jgi:hypothetical protein